MSDIQKIKLIHDVKNVLGIDAELAHKLADQIEDSEIKERINSFFASYKVEDIFQYLFSVLPSVRLIHKLDQNQLPSTSKADFQVPDFLVLFRTSKGVDKALLVDIKFAQRNKLTFNIMQNQHLISKNYSFTLNIELLYAIYWQNYNLWTLNTVDHFEQKTNTLRIQLLTAVQNDLSAVLGDDTIFINFPIFRKTLFNPLATDKDLPRHKKYGAMIKVEVSNNGQTFNEISTVESAVIDSFIVMREKHKTMINNMIEIVDKSNLNYAIKLSTLISKHLAIFSSDINEHYSMVSRNIIYKLMDTIKPIISVMLPNNKTKTTDKIFKLAFEKSHIWDKYTTKL